MIDTHVYVARWPFRRLPADETPKLVRTLARHGISTAWAGSFDALLHRDLAAVNMRLAEECATPREVRLVPFGAVNPMLPAWEEDLRRCHEVHHMPGVRLHPDFHGYSLQDPCFARLLERAAARRLIVQVCLGMDDPRGQGPFARLAPVNPEPLADLLPRISSVEVVLLNFWRTFRANRVLLSRLARLPRLSFDLATLEGTGGIETLLHSTPGLRLMLGTYAPFFAVDATTRKLEESSIPDLEQAAIRRERAAALVPVP